VICDVARALPTLAEDALRSDAAQARRERATVEPRLDTEGIRPVGYVGALR
jgi:hypothetical protein